MKRLTVLLFALACTALGLNISKECKSPGIKRSITPGKFGVCVEKDGKLQYVENECSKGLTFDAARKACTKVFPRAIILQASNSTKTTGSTSSRPATSPSRTASPRLLTTVPPSANTRPCRGPGVYCSNCNTLSFCVSYNLPTGAKFLKTILDLPCGDDSVCVTQQGCVKKFSGGLCREGTFTCGDVGLYPDLYDCRKYHSCTVGPLGQLIDTPITCSGGLLGNKWNPQTSTCGWSEDDDSCRKYPVPLCTKPLEMRAVVGQIYSICIVDEINHTLSPKLFRCPRDLVFNASIYACV